MNNKKAAIPPAIFLGLVLMSQASGNDKMPFLVLGTVMVYLVLLFVFGFKIFIKSGDPVSIKSLFVGVGVTLLYVGIIILLSLDGVVDPYYFLGFR